MAPPHSPATRLGQVTGHLTAKPRPKVLANSFRPKLPAGLPPSYTPLNPLSFLLKAASIRPDHPALLHPAKSLSYTFSEWATRVSYLAYALRSRGIKAGDRVLVCAPNVPMTADALQAICALQAIIVPINVRLTPAEVTYLLENSGAKFVLVDSEFAHLVAATKVPVIVSNDSGLAADPYEKFLVEGREYDLRNGGFGWEGLEFQADELATFAISYTSGTTSRPKGVETSYRGTYLAAIANAVESGLTPSSRYLWILPMFHCLGWCFPYANTMAMSTQVCLRSVGDYSEVWKGFLERGVTHYSGAPTVQLSITSSPLARKLDHVVNTTIAGAAPTATLIAGLETIGINVTHVYGLTETYGPITRTYFPDPLSPDYFKLKARQGSAFLTADDIRVVKLIPEGEELNVKEGQLEEVRFDGSEVGEIVMRGNIVMKGYYGDENASAKAFAGGYFHTGDLAVRFPDGTFNIQDRSKDIIISGGENVSSLFVEAELTAHPDVLEVAVVARPHEKWGERPHAFVVLKDGAKWHGRHADFSTALKAHAKGRMPGFATPEWVEVVEQLEKTSTGKVQKKVLRDALIQRYGKK